MQNVSSRVFLYVPRVIALVALAVVIGVVLASLTYLALSLMTSAGDAMPRSLELAPFRWLRKDGHG